MHESPRKIDFIALFDYFISRHGNNCFYEFLRRTSPDDSIIHKAEKKHNTILASNDFLLLKNGNYGIITVYVSNPVMRVTAMITEGFSLPCEVSLDRRMFCVLGGCLFCSVGGTDGNRY